MTPREFALKCTEISFGCGEESVSAFSKIIRSAMAQAFTEGRLAQVEWEGNAVLRSLGQGPHDLPNPYLKESP